MFVAQGRQVLLRVAGNSNYFVRKDRDMAVLECPVCIHRVVHLLRCVDDGLCGGSLELALKPRRPGSGYVC